MKIFRHVASLPVSSDNGGCSIRNVLLYALISVFALLFLASCATSSKLNPSFATLDLKKAHATSQAATVKRDVEYSVDTCYYSSNDIIDCHVLIKALRKNEIVRFDSGRSDESSHHTFIVDQLGNKYPAKIFAKKLTVPGMTIKSVVLRADTAGVDFITQIKVLNLGVTSFVIRDRNMGVQLTNIKVENTPNTKLASDLKDERESFSLLASTYPVMNYIQRHPMVPLSFMPATCDNSFRSSLLCRFFVKAEKLQPVTMMTRNAYIYDQNGRKYVANKITLAGNTWDQPISTILPVDTLVVAGLIVTPYPAGIEKITKIEFTIGPVLRRRPIVLTDFVMQ